MELLLQFLIAGVVAIGLIAVGKHVISGWAIGRSPIRGQNKPSQTTPLDKAPPPPPG